VLVGWFRERGNVRVFRHGWCEEAENFAPQVIAARWAQLETLIARGLAGPERTVVVLVRPREILPGVLERERLWRAFRVPVFVQIIGKRGELLAAECDAHDGLHVESQTYTPEGPLEAAPCECGRTTPRLFPAEPAAEVRAVAAYAR
jgi:hypothetical protein